MKKHNFIISFLFICAAFITSCSLHIEERKFSGDKTEVYFDIRDSNGNARTALPDFDFDFFKYTLTATKNGIPLEAPLVSNTTYSTFNGSLGIDPAVYTFTLTGYNENQKSVLQGVSESIDLTKGSAVVQFRMYPLSGEGLTGSAEITVNLPSDGVIKTVKACVSESISSLPEDFTTIDVTSSRVIYTPTNIPAGKKEYAVMFFYDKDGGCISSVYESLIIVAGQTSKSVRTISTNMYHKYQVNIKFITESDTGKIESVFSTKTLTVMGADGNKYYLTLASDGSFGGMLPEQSYSVIYNNVNTGVTFTSPNYTNSVGFKKIDLPTGGIELTNISNAVESADKNYVLVPDTASDFSAIVKVKDGYKIDNSKVLVNNNFVSDGETISISSNVSSIVTSGVSPIEYQIDYKFDNGGKFVQGYNGPSIYTVENYPTLPLYSNVEAPDGKFFDGWKNSDTNVLMATIPEGTTGNISLVAVYKDGATISETDKVIYASGFNLLIQWKEGSRSFTEVYYDDNGNGKLDSGEKPISQGINFTDYVLKAGKKDGTPIASDFTFTMLGGKISSIEGLGKDKSNKSTVNISGESIIGDGSSKGIDLSSLTNEKINIVGQMTGSYSITLLSEHAYDPNSSSNRIIADITNPDYAQLKNFICIPKGDARDSEYVTNDNGKLTLKLSSKTVNAGTQSARSYIYLFNPNPIAFPSGIAGSENGIIWEQDGDTLSDRAFTLGDSANIDQECSVFSLSVKNGTFKIKSSTDGTDPTKMVDMYGNVIVTDDLCQYKSGTSIAYRAKTNTSGAVLKANEEYVYIHMFSTTNAITADAASKFLKNIIFIKDSANSKIDITLNLETVPYEEISNFISKGITVSIPTRKPDGTYDRNNMQNVSIVGTAFSYYDGSFYLGVKGTRDWIDAYNIAKQVTFNGLNGYLMTINSEVENNYIEACMKLSMSWMGGSRMVPQDNQYDSMEYTISKTTQKIKYQDKVVKNNNNGDTFTGEFYGTDFKWQCGPDAGKVFSTGKFNYSGSGTNRSPYKISGYVITGIPSDSYANWESGEPNNYNNLPENTVQFHSNGQWNDLPWNIESNSDYAPKGYIIEFTPYKNENFVNEPGKKNIVATASY